MDRRLESAIERGDLKSIRTLLATDPSLAEGQPNRRQPIHCAAGNGRSKILELLIEHGADVNAVDQDGRTPLHEADLSPQCVKILIREGASLNSVDARFGHTPWSWAILNQQPEGLRVAKLLKAAGAEYDLRAAVAMGDLGRVQQILKSDPDSVIHVQPQELLLSLAWSIQFYGTVTDRMEILRTLFANGLSLDKQVLLQHAKAATGSQFTELPKLLRSHAKNAGRTETS